MSELKSAQKGLCSTGINAIAPVARVIKAPTADHTSHHSSLQRHHSYLLIQISKCISLNLQRGPHTTKAQITADRSQDTVIVDSRELLKGANLSILLSPDFAKTFQTSVSQLEEGSLHPLCFSPNSTTTTRDTC